MHKIKVKPLSVNDAWKGQRFKTDEYKIYEQICMLLLPKFTAPGGKLCLYLCFGMSSSSSDWDNPIKPFQDVMQKRYGFNDNRVYRAVVDKVKTAKGSEYVLFDLLPLEQWATLPLRTE